MTYQPPALDGNPLLHHLVDSQAALHPQRPFFCYTQDNLPEQIVYVSHLEFSRASHRAARLLSDLPEYDHERREVVAILASADTLVYTAVMVGACRAGLVPVLVAPYLTLDSMVELLRGCSCTRILTTPTQCSVAEKIVAQLHDAEPEVGIRVDLFPVLHQLYPSLGTEDIDSLFQPFHEQVKDVGLEDVYFYMHSSGSTGSPKLVPYSRKSVTSRCRAVFYERWSALSPPLRLAVMSVYMFHISGVASALLAPIMSGACMATYPPTADSTPYATTPASGLAHSRRAGCNAMLAMPSLIQLWAYRDEDVEYLTTLRFVLYGGGPMVSRIGDLLSGRGVKLVCIYGSTEAGIVSDLEVIDVNKVPKGWTYQRIASNIPVSWIDQENGTYEPHFLVSPEYTPCVVNLPKDEGFATTDVLEPHPLDSNLWRCVGRLNHVLVLSTGYKVAPEPLEDTIGAHSSVQVALIFGRGRSEPGVLVEPRPGALAEYNEEEVEKFKAALWPTIQEACAGIPIPVRITQAMVLLTSVEKPLPRSAKGSILVKAALEYYEREIEELYTSRELTANESSRPVL